MGDQPRMFIKEAVIGFISPQKVFRLELVAIFGHGLLRRRFLEWRFASHHRVFVLQRYPPQHSTLIARKVCSCVNRTAIIPHHNIAGSPLMFIDEFGFALMFKQEVQ